MDLILAMDLKGGLVVHGCSGNRKEYLPLDWGRSPTAEPVGFVGHLSPRFLYIADLDRIEGTGDHDRVIRECAGLVERCYVDRGMRGPGDLLEGKGIVPVVGTETATGSLPGYRGFLSVDVKDGRVMPTGEDPVRVLAMAEECSFDGCILLNISAVGTSRLPGINDLTRYREAYNDTLLYGGGIAGTGDLETICDLGFDGAILATALHRGVVPLEWIRRGTFCS